MRRAQEKERKKFKKANTQKRKSFIFSSQPALDFSFFFLLFFFFSNFPSAADFLSLFFFLRNRTPQLSTAAAAAASAALRGLARLFELHVSHGPVVSRFFFWEIPGCHFADRSCFGVGAPSSWAQGLLGVWLDFFCCRWDSDSRSIDTNVMLCGVPFAPRTEGMESDTFCVGGIQIKKFRKKNLLCVRV